MSADVPQPDGITRLMPGLYTVVIRGPKGMLLDMGISLENRGVVDGTIEDAHLQELLVVSSVVGGMIEGQLHAQHRLQSTGKPFTATTDAP